MGTDFILAFPNNYRTSKEIHLYIVSNESDFSGYISSPHPGVTKNFYTTNGSVTLNLPTSLELVVGKFKKAVFLKLSKPVAVFAMENYECCSGEAFHVYPKQNLGQSYTAMSVHPFSGSYITVIGTSNDTKLSITLNTSTSGTVSYNGYGYNNGEQMSLSLNEMEAIQIRSSRYNMAGSHIISNKPVAVITGNVCTKRFTESCSQLIEYLVPNNKCGKNYIVPPIKGAKTFIKTSSNSSSTLTIQGGSLTGTNRPTGETELDSDESYTLVSDNSTCVYLFSYDHENPMMTTLPSVEQYTNDAVFPKPTSPVFSNYMSVVVKSSSLGNLRLNNNRISNVNVNRVTLDSTEYSTFWMALPNDTSIYHVFSTSPDDRFGAIVYGYKHAEAYAYPAALGL